MSDKDKPIDRRLEAFREENGTDVEAFVAGWRDGSIERSDENARRAEQAERLWEEVKALGPGA